MSRTRKLAALLALAVCVLLLLVSSAQLGRSLGARSAEALLEPGVVQAESYAAFFRMELFYYPDSALLEGIERYAFDHTFFFRVGDDTAEVVTALQNYLWLTDHGELTGEQYDAIAAFLREQDCDRDHYFREDAVCIAADAVRELLALFPAEALDHISGNYQALAAL